MEDLILALLSGIADLILEVLLQWIGEALIVLIVRFIRTTEEAKIISPVLAAAEYLLLGMGFGVLSVLVFPHPLVHPSKIHGISLVISPLITGWIMSQIGLVRRNRGKGAVRLESFGYGFTFAFGVAAIRFFFVR